MKRALRQRVKLGLPLTPWDREDVLDSDAALRAEVRRLRVENEQVRSVLKRVEFGHAVTQHKCLVCWGWNVGPNGETPRVHAPGCEMAAALAPRKTRGTK